MRLIIEITYHSDALAVSAERLPPDDDRRVRGVKKEERGEKQRTQKETRVSQRRRSCVRTWARRCVKADRVLFVRIVEPWTLISRFREIIRGGCVISFLVISCSTRRGMLRIRVPCTCSRATQQRGCFPFRAGNVSDSDASRLHRLSFLQIALNFCREKK